MKHLSKLTDELLKRMDGSYWKCVAPLLNVTFKGEGEEHTRKIFIIDLVRLTKLNEIKNMFGYGCSILTIKL